MISPIDERLRDEARRFRFVFACPSCMWFDVERRSCALGFPNEEHLDERLDARPSVVFCKAFELT